MSLVLEALRRVEKTDGRPGSVGVAIPSYRPARPRARRSWWPLLLGIGTGAFLLLPWPRTRPAAPGEVERSSSSPPSSAPALAASVPVTTPVAPAAGVLAQPTRSAPSAGPSSIAGEATPAPRTTARPRATPSRPAPAPALVLQAVSERDSKPIAIVSDRLVREGDLIDGVRIMKIGADSVEVLMMDGTRELVRFAPPPPVATPTP